MENIGHRAPGSKAVVRSEPQQNCERDAITSRRGEMSTYTQGCPQLDQRTPGRSTLEVARRLPWSCSKPSRWPLNYLVVYTPDPGGGGRTARQRASSVHPTWRQNPASIYKLLGHAGRKFPYSPRSTSPQKQKVLLVDRVEFF